jgi:hypothetical protein
VKSANVKENARSEGRLTSPSYACSRREHNEPHVNVSLSVLLQDRIGFEDYENLTDPEARAMEFAENLESALEQFGAIYEELGEGREGVQ